MCRILIIVLQIASTSALRIGDSDCQALLDDYCSSACDLRARGCGFPPVARFSGPSAKGIAWRCYSPETLDNNQTYTGGDCYCSRDDELEEVLALCFNDVVTVFSSEMAGSACYRIPTITRLSSGTLLAFAEQRVGGCGDNGDNNIVLRQSSDDGKSWGAIVTVAKGNGKPLSNPNPVEVDMGNGSKAVLLHYDTMNNPSAAKHGANMQVWSYDEGVTWVYSRDISSAMPSGYAGCMPGPSVGLQSSDGSLYFSCHGFGLNGFLYWSSDLGASWEPSAVQSGTMNECSIALLANESIAMNCRTGGSYRAQLTWSANGSLVGQILRPEGLIDPNCQGSLIAHEGQLFLSNDNTTSGRTHIAVKQSADDGATWDEGSLEWAGPSGYSQLVAWPGRMGLLFELGVKSTYESIGFRSWPA